jgi:hypothetical protein
MIENGYAKFYPSENKLYELEFKKLETMARNQKVGMWGQCEKEIAKQEAQEKKDEAEKNKFKYTTDNIPPPNPKCLIKGNISNVNSTKGGLQPGDKIYFTPGCPNYETVKVDPARGEEYFCTEEDAKKSGFAKAFMCL